MTWKIHPGDALSVLRTLADESVHCCVTSPPYWGLRDYGVAGQLGLESTPEEYVSKMVAVFREVKRVLRSDGTLWLNIGDTYAGSRSGEKRQLPHHDGREYDSYLQNGRVPAPKGTNNPRHDKSKRIPRGAGRWGGGNNPAIGDLKPKDIVGVPWMLAFALRADGWYLRSDIIWAKPNPMPESVSDRPTKAHEYLFLLAKSERYYYDAEAIAESCLDPEDDLRRIHQIAIDHKSAPDAHKNGLRSRNDRFGGNKYGGEKHSEQSLFTGRETRNKRSVWSIATSPFPEAHFATFPPDLIEPCIKAGTSDHGCCDKCGTPWARIVETETSNRSNSAIAGNKPNGKLAGGSQVREDHDIRLGPTVSTKTIGWKQGCRCANSKTVPGTVLDPFSGAGTTGLVARRLLRQYVGIELNSEYVAMSEDRIIRDAPMFNTPEVPA